MSNTFKILDRKFLLHTGGMKVDRLGKFREDCMLYELYTADSFTKRLMGYMFRRKPHHEAMLFKNCSSIHTFFMRFDIDVYFLNENMEIIKIVEGVKPGKVIYPVSGAVNVVEIPRLKS